MTTPPPYRSGVELLAAVDDLAEPIVRAARTHHLIPTVGDQEWWDAPPVVQLAAVLLLAKAHLLAEQLRAADGIRGASVAISRSGVDWAANGYASYVELQRRRSEPGPLVGIVFDPVAAARWVETGDSSEGASAA